MSILTTTLISLRISTRETTTTLILLEMAIIFATLRMMISFKVLEFAT
jgi:hypothetical protein